VDYGGEATLLHPLALRDGGTSEVRVQHVGLRKFRLSPYPFSEPETTFQLRARFVPGKNFASREELKQKLDDAKMEEIAVSIAA
jgi:hypothetical protein